MISDYFKFSLTSGDIAFLSGVVEMAANAFLVEAGNQQEDIVADVFELSGEAETLQESFQNRISQYVTSLEYLNFVRRKELRKELKNINITLKKQDSGDVTDNIIRAFGWKTTADVKRKVGQFLDFLRCYLQEPIGTYQIVNRELYCNKAVEEVYDEIMWMDDILIQYPRHIVLVVCASSE